MLKFITILVGVLGGFLVDFVVGNSAVLEYIAALYLRFLFFSFGVMCAAVGVRVCHRGWCAI
jgi:hypothetical protein